MFLAKLKYTSEQLNAKPFLFIGLEVFNLFKSICCKIGVTGSFFLSGVARTSKSLGFSM
jgi:hypothetical protein